MPTEGQSRARGGKRGKSRLQHGTDKVPAMQCQSRRRPAVPLTAALPQSHLSPDGLVGTQAQAELFCREAGVQTRWGTAERGEDKHRWQSMPSVVPGRCQEGVAQEPELCPRHLHPHPVPDDKLHVAVPGKGAFLNKQDSTSRVLPSSWDAE